MLNPELWFSLFKATRWHDISLNVFHILCHVFLSRLKNIFLGKRLESSCWLKSQLPPVRRRRLFKAKSRLVDDKAIFSNCLEVDHPMCRAGLLQRALSAECSANDKWGSRSPPPPPPPPRPMNEWQKSEHPGLCRCTVHPPKDFQPHSFQRR